ncbi:MAG TPA: RnfH family protein [Rhodanobacteraceae bacterium]|jgi:putative ubiquitin-RnfH superfamily antitoxin RatB of RatAB toxin-antitoxin module
MPERATIRVSVVCAAPDRVFLRELELPQGASVGDAIAGSGFRQAWPEVPVSDDRVGIFARKTDLRATLRDGDRVEIYRPLKIDPKDARRKRAQR